jgi:hypothetical protein
MRICLRPLNHYIAGDCLTRSCIVERMRDDDVENESELWFQLDKSIQPPAMMIVTAI